MRILCLFPLFLFATISSDINTALRALQQIRTLIPERLQEQEFSIVIDRKAFKQSMKKLSENPLRESSVPALIGIGCSQYYLLRWTVSGEAVRILDLYQEFEYGPFWNYPSALDTLYDYHHEHVGSW
jgi:hypothetical protein